MISEMTASAKELFGAIKSVKKIYLSDSSVIVTILSSPERIDRCDLYDAERKMAERYPDMGLTFYSSEGEANYSAYKVIYEN